MTGECHPGLVYGTGTWVTLVTGRVLDEAYAWLRSRRLDRSATNDFSEAIATHIARGKLPVESITDD